MGLDNIPADYACVRAGTEVLRAGTDIIDCTATAAIGGCPWLLKVASEKPGNPVTGMLGAPCWYRGKVGVRQLALLNDAGYVLPTWLEGGFYGDIDATPALSVEHCIQLADWLANHAEAFAASAAVCVSDAQDVRDEIETYQYAVWWLRFVAAECNGANSWY
jgi:hypothetical protein